MKCCSNLLILSKVNESSNRRNRIILAKIKYTVMFMNTQASF